MLFRRTVAALASLGALLVLPAGNAVASTGPVVPSPDQAGYSVTGAHFDAAQAWVRLPDPSRFSRYIGQLSVSVQLMTSRSLFDFTATACTDATCLPGGPARSRKYHLELAVYRRATGALVCSTSAAGSQRCPYVPASWNRARIAPGRLASFSLVYPSSHDFVFAIVNGQEYDYPFRTNSVFAQARVGLEFGATPWARAPFRAPRTAIAVARFDRPPPPPYWAEIATVKGRGSGIAAAWWAHHQVRMTGGSSGRRLEAVPGALGDSGYAFTVSLEP